MGGDDGGLALGLWGWSFLDCGAAMVRDKERPEVIVTVLTM